MKTLLFQCLFIFIYCENIDTSKLLSLQKIILSNPTDSTVLRDNAKMPLILNFYNIEDESFLLLTPYIGYYMNGLKGYYEYDDYLVLCYDLNNTLISNCIHLSMIDTIYLKSNYLNVENYDIDIDQSLFSYYKIINDSLFKEFIPDDRHKFQLDSLMMIQPPPLPNDQ